MSRLLNYFNYYRKLTRTTLEVVGFVAKGTDGRFQLPAPISVELGYLTRIASVEDDREILAEHRNIVAWGLFGRRENDWHDAKHLLTVCPMVLSVDEGEREEAETTLKFYFKSLAGGLDVFNGAFVKFLIQLSR